MKKIDQGRYEVFTSKGDAIDKFMQMQGLCRGKINREDPIGFYCSKKGKITITDPPARRGDRRNSTALFAEVTEQDGKTYVTYYTGFSQFNHVAKGISLALNIIVVVVAIVLAVINADKTASFVVLILALAFFAFQLFTNAKEERRSPEDSEILINELEKRVEAVNLWDK